MPLATLVLGATFHIDSASRGRRQIPAEDMFVSFYTNALEPDEIITWISVPATRAGQGWGFVEYAHQHGDYGLAGAGCVLDVGADGRIAAVRCAVLSAADRPLLFTADDVVGERPSDRMWDALATRWARATEPSAEDPEYARRLCEAAVRQSLAAAHERAGNQEGNPDAEH